MIIGIPNEIKIHEYRIAITPAGVDMLVHDGHKVIIEKGAGLGSSIPDEVLSSAGAQMVERDEVFEKSELILKVKEPQPSEIEQFNRDQAIFSFFHFAADQALTEGMMNSGATCIAYETVQTDDGTLPLLAPMSEVAGRVAITAAGKYLERPDGGKGKLLSRIAGVPAGKVMILGGGVAGTSAARSAGGLGADVYIFEVSQRRLGFLNDIFPANIHPIASNSYTIRDMLPQMDVVIGTVLIPGARAPVLVSEAMVKTLEPGSVIIDVAIDQGGCIETARPTTHADPTYKHEGIIHYCVSNMPGAVSHTSTYGLANATMPYILELAGKGWKRAVEDNAALRKGVNICEGQICHPAVADAFGMTFVPLPV